jgi:hypothetical protein
VDKAEVDKICAFPELLRKAFYDFDAHFGILRDGRIGLMVILFGWFVCFRVVFLVVGLLALVFLDVPPDARFGLFLASFDIFLIVEFQLVELALATLIRVNLTVRQEHKRLKYPLHILDVLRRHEINRHLHLILLHHPQRQIHKPLNMALLLFKSSVGDFRYHF